MNYPKCFGRTRLVAITLPVLMLLAALLPTAAGAGQPTSATLANGLILEAPGDSPWLRLRHPALEGHVNLLSPELINDDATRLIYMDTGGHGVDWRREGDALSARYSQPGVGDYTLRLSGDADGVRMDYTISNCSPHAWEDASLTVCMQNHHLPALFDPREERSHVRAGGAWRVVNTVVEAIGSNWLIPPGREPADLMRSSLEHGSYRLGLVAPDEAIAAVASAEGGWILAQAWHAPRYINVNTGLDRGIDYACTDVAPALGTIPAGHTLRLRGKLYFFRGSLDALASAYSRDRAEGVIFCDRPVPLPASPSTPETP